LRPDGINWPLNDEGNPSTKLEHLTAANNIEHNAHDALADVKATIAIAKLIKKSNSKLYDYALKSRSKDSIKKMLGVSGNRIKNPKPLLYISSVFSSKRNCISIVLPIAVDAERKNNIIVVDLLSDITPLLELESSRAIRERVFIPKEKLLEGESRVPLHCVSANKCPIFVGLEVLKKEDIIRLGLDLSYCKENLKLLQSRDDIEIVARHVYGPYKDIERDPELAIYDRFLADEDKAILPDIRGSDPEELKYFQFEDPRMPELMFRYRARNFPKTLSEKELIKWEEYRYNRLTNSIEIKKNQDSLTFETYFAELDERLQSVDLTPYERKILQKLQQYGKKLEKSLSDKPFKVKN
jgi:exodeoxyribonuclease-1